jgi:hypothetical protein
MGFPVTGGAGLASKGLKAPRQRGEETSSVVGGKICGSPALYSPACSRSDVELKVTGMGS